MLTTLKQKNPFGYAILRFVILLILVQAFRAIITISLWFVLKPGSQPVLWDWINLAGFIITGVVLLVVFRPSIESLGLSMQGMRRGQKIAYAVGLILLVALVITSSLVDASLLLANVVSVFIIPIFEELLFRGYGWYMLKQSDRNTSDNAIWMWLTFLFGLWHLGYVDVFVLRSGSSIVPASLLTLLFLKMIVGWIYGMVAGFVRLRTGKVYASIWIHGLGNLFGR